MAGGGAFLRAAGRAVHMLWLEVTGFIFLCFSVIGGFAAIREYRAYSAGKIPPGRAVLAICFTVMFAYFGLSSFIRSRRRHS
jgi:threonine/homoserine/homoserine lactone efflux protein